MKIFATRPKLFMSMLLRTNVGLAPAAPSFMRAFFLPYCATNLPSRVNFRMCASGRPLPPIHTKPL